MGQVGRTDTPPRLGTEAGKGLELEAVGDSLQCLACLTSAVVRLSSSTEGVVQRTAIVEHEVSAAWMHSLALVPPPAP